MAMIAGGMIGSSIFSLSGLTMTAAGPAAIITWAIAAAIMLCYGLVCAELSTRFPKSGGVFVFPSKALGKQRSRDVFGDGYPHGDTSTQILLQLRLQQFM